MLRIVTYHRVAPLNDRELLNPRMISATPEVFQQHMRFLSQKYRVVSMENVLAAIDKKAILPKRAVLITFDDAYYDFAEYAWPVLKKLKLPATVFVPTGFPDHPERAFWWDRLYQAFAQTSLSSLETSPIGALPLRPAAVQIDSLKRLQNHIKTLAHEQAMALVDEVCAQLGVEPVVQKSVLSWDELRQLAKEGVALGAHTRSHPIMTRLSKDEIRAEIVASRGDLASEVGDSLPIFCYPSGGHSDGVVEILKQEKCTLAVTTRDSHKNLQHADPFRLRRTNITRKSTLPVFRLRLTRWMTAVDGWRHRNDHRVTAVNANEGQ